MAPSKKGDTPKRTKRVNSKATRKTKRANLKPIAEEEETITMTQGELDALIAEQVAEILAMEASKNTSKTTEGNSSRAVFRLCECTDGSRVKYATGTLIGGALSWWSGYVNSIEIDAANASPWEEVKEMMKGEYCPRNEIQKLEIEFWYLVVKGNNVVEYTRRFYELSVLCPTMVTPEYKRLERYIWGLPQSIQGNVTASKPITLSSAISLAHDLMDQVIRHNGATKIAEIRSNDNKRKLDENQERSYEQHLYKEPNVIKAYYVRQSSNSSYLGTKPFCNICKRHHTRDCREVAWGNNSSCFNCGEKGHLRRNCPMFLDHENEQQHED
uniref:uncharacterized protein LOC122610283 n=1 Tax=Erigeron canadensis TaxID=72917 RepID=UPI001CB937A9|nr:uncharacterized protein LOC122610283 [Erigeron canadensis]